MLGYRPVISQLDQPAAFDRVLETGNLPTERTDPCLEASHTRLCAVAEVLPEGLSLSTDDLRLGGLNMRRTQLDYAAAVAPNQVWSDECLDGPGPKSCI